ncbi:hypothetical protein B0H10DRAFT_2234565 [Mycena sp. CBHHK59/15]|nr:hypothetical protein B0H10DRAFT_2234565 [Mycena sp. CBHHK59/15]
MLPQRTPPDPHAADHNHLHPRLPSIRQLHPYLPPIAPTLPPPPPDHPHVSTSDSDRADEHELEHDDNDGQPPKKRRRRQPLSCTECKRRKIRCDRNQPCAPCVRRGDQAKCQCHAIEPATEKYVLRAEHDALRARVDALDVLVHHLQVSSPPAPALSHAHSHPHPLPPTFHPFMSHSSSSATTTSTNAQHPDLLYQTLRTHSPRSSPVTHEARISPTEAVTRILPAGARAPLPGRVPARAGRALDGAAVSPTEYSHPISSSASYPASSGHPGGQGNGNGGRGDGREREAREDERDEHGALRVDVNVHPSPPHSSPVYAHHHAQEVHVHGQGYPPHMFRRSSFGGGGGAELARRPNTGSGASRHIIGDASLAERRASYSALVLVDLPRCGGPAVVGGSICTAISSATRASGRF